MLFQIASATLPPGDYTARFLGEIAITNTYGDGIQWRFQIVGGDLHGKMVSRVTGNVPQAGSTCYCMLCGILGREPVENEEVDTSPYLNRQYRISLQPSPKTGKIRVESATLLTTGNAVSAHPPTTSAGPPATSVFPVVPSATAAAQPVVDGGVSGASALPPISPGQGGWPK